MKPRKIDKHSLDIRRTLPYFLGHVECGKVLSKKIVEKINFKNGSFFTILPDNALVDRIYDFDCGGIIPPDPPGGKGYVIRGFKEKFYPHKITTMSQVCSKWIVGFLNGYNERWAVIENYMLDINSPHVVIKNVKMVPFLSDVYFILNKNNSVEEVLEAVQKSTQVWHFLTVLTCVQNPIPSVLTEKIMDQICDNVEFIVAGAYDGEGYVFWEKSSSSRILTR